MIDLTLGPHSSAAECTCFGGTYTKIGTIQRRLAWPLRKDDTQNREAFHIFARINRLKNYQWQYLHSLQSFVKIIYVSVIQIHLTISHSQFESQAG